MTESSLMYDELVYAIYEHSNMELIIHQDEMGLVDRLSSNYDVTDADGLFVLHGIITSARCIPDPESVSSSLDAYIIVEDRSQETGDSDIVSCMVFEGKLPTDDLCDQIRGIIEKTNEQGELVDFDIGIDDIHILWGCQLSLCLMASLDEVDQTMARSIKSFSSRVIKAGSV